MHQAQPIQNIEILLQTKAAEIMEDDGASESPKHMASDSHEHSPRDSGLKSTLAHRVARPPRLEGVDSPPRQYDLPEEVERDYRNLCKEMLADGASQSDLHPRGAQGSAKGSPTEAKNL